MWKYDSDYKKWISTNDTLTKDSYELLKQELSSVRFYSKCLSGASYLPMNDINNIYDILGEYEDRNWYIGLNGSPYSNSLIPPQHAVEITDETSYEYYNKYLGEYGLTLKNLFTPDRLIKDSINNYIYVDVATTTSLFLGSDILNVQSIDGVRLKNGHRVLIKDQKSTEVLPNTTNPEEYFEGPFEVIQNLGATIEYEYYNNENGIYKYEDGKLVKENDLDDYDKCVRFSVNVKLGDFNTGKQFHLSRLNNGYYPTSDLDQPMQFIEKHNWLLRNRVDYNNLFEINYYSVIKHVTQTYNIAGITYSIPERTISVGEFGIIHNFQENVSNIINNKYKENLRSISQTSKYYWICGDRGLLLKVRKHDFNIEKVEVDCRCPRNLTITNLNSISFYDDLRGVAVGDLNTLLVTEDGGLSWEKIIIDDFNAYYYNKVVYYNAASFFIGGDAGVFIEFKKDIGGWIAYKRRISRFIDDDDEYLLVDNINDLYYTNIDTWGLSFSYSTQSTATEKELLFIVTDDSKIIAHDINGSIPGFDFVYLDFGSSGVNLNEYGDIQNIIRRQGTNIFYFTGMDQVTGDSGLFSFDIDVFNYIGVGNEYSNTITTITSATFESEYYPNETFDYNGDELLICGNNSLLYSSTYSTTFNFQVFDVNFENRLKSKMLFLDYDMGAKLNWFTDDGEYRLPNSLEVNAGSFSVGSYLSFDPIVHSATAPSFMTQSEITWYQYWADRNKTFEYYNNTSLPLDESSKVEISFDFYYTATQSEITISSVTSSLSGIINLAPTIGDSTASRFNGLSLTPISAPASLYDLYLYDYLMISKVPTSYFVNVGDVMRLESSVIESEFVVNKIYTSGGNKYLYMFTEFNQNIITELSTTTYSITLTNLNKYSDIDELKENFNLHPISNGYEFFSNDNFTYQLYLDFLNGAVNTYDNWNIDPSFSNSPTIAYNLGSLQYSSSPYSIRTSPGENIIESPLLFGVDNIEFIYSPRKTGSLVPDPGNSIESGYSNGTYSTITVEGFSTDTSSWESITDYIMPLTGLNILNNGVKVNIPVSGGYNRFRFKLFEGSGTYSYNTTTGPPFYLPIVSVASNSVYINIDDIKISGDSLIVEPNSYGLTYSNNVTYGIKPLFNNLTSYYNLSTNLVISGDYKTMSYTSGFLKFGYTPTYNILDYLESINDIGDPSPVFYADKEYYAMPDYRGIPLQGIGNINDDIAYIDYNGMTYSNTTGNRVLFGKNLKLEWESIFINTFVDVRLYDTNIYPSAYTTTERLLVMKKYFSQKDDAYVIEFHKKLNHVIGTSQYFIDIISRRKLYQISDDLQELNNIHRAKLKTTDNLLIGSSFDSYERELNFKIPTDSYAKILLSDAETIQELSAIFYVDYKNELAMNMTRLEREYNIPILTTSNFSGNLFIACSEKHDLKTGDGVVLEFIGDVDGLGNPIIEGSSLELNQQYFGYHTVIVVNQFNFYVDIPYGSTPTVGNDRGFVKFVKKDPFLNYTPVDIIDVGVDKKGKISIELSVDNIKLSEDVYSLVDVDFNKYRFRLVDGLNIEELSRLYPWILEAEISEAVLGIKNGQLVWYKGTWECGRWFGGIWYSGVWLSGDWYGGEWYSKIIKDNYIKVEVDEKSSDVKQSTWFGGRWYDGLWNNGLWVDGRWYGGTWNNGLWYKGIWNDGTWNNGIFGGGVWVLGDWNNGVFNTNNEPAYWLDGEWHGGDFENGIWYNGLFESKDVESRFGTNAYNSRTATWHGGDWVSGSFHSRLNINDDGEYDVSDVHKYSIWRTGKWFAGDFYGGIAYNIDFNSGIWHGGILEDIQVIGFGSDGDGQHYFMINGKFKFNTGDELNIIDNQLDNTYSTFGSNSDPGRYTVLYVVEDDENNWTKVYVNEIIPYDVIPPVDLGLRLVSRFRFCNWKSGIWTNGLYEGGLWEGGLWYNGVFGDATWM